MRTWIKKHWGALLAALGFNFPSLWQGIKWIWDWFGRLDLVASHLPHFKKIGDMIGFIFNPPPWMIFPSVIIGGLIIWWDVRRARRPSKLPAFKAKMSFPIIGMILCGLGLIGFASWYFFEPTSTAPENPKAEETELHKRAQSDFMHTGGIAKKEEKISFLPNLALELTAEIWVHSDLISMGKYIVIYIPHTVDFPKVPSFSNVHNSTIRITYDVCKILADRYKNILSAVNSEGAAGTGDMTGQNFRYSTATIFTVAIYIYYEGSLTEEERVELKTYFHERSATAFFRDYRYISESRPSSIGQ